MGVPGAIAANIDGTSNIYVNTLYCENIQRKTIRHELRHMVNNHAYCDWMTVQEKELEADEDDGSCIFADDFSFVEGLCKELSRPLQSCQMVVDFR